MYVTIRAVSYRVVKGISALENEQRISN